MATRAQIRRQVEQAATPLLAQLAGRQRAYLAKTGRYWQGLPLFGTVPADGAENAPDKTKVKPHYQAEDWDEMGNLPAKLPMDVRCDQYESPTGRGYLVTLTVLVAGKVNTITYAYGPEAYRAHDWQEE